MAFSKSLAREVARGGVRVNCVSPAVTETAFKERLADDPIGSRIVEGAIRSTPMRRAAMPAEIAEAVAFLGSPRGRLHHRQVLSVSGAWRCRGEAPRLSPELLPAAVAREQLRGGLSADAHRLADL